MTLRSARSKIWEPMPTGWVLRIWEIFVFPRRWPRTRIMPARWCELLLIITFSICWRRHPTTGFMPSLCRFTWTINCPTTIWPWHPRCSIPPPFMLHPLLIMCFASIMRCWLESFLVLHVFLRSLWRLTRSKSPRGGWWFAQRKLSRRSMQFAHELIRPIWLHNFGKSLMLEKLNSKDFKEAKSHHQSHLGRFCATPCKMTFFTTFVAQTRWCVNISGTLFCATLTK